MTQLHPNHNAHGMNGLNMQHERAESPMRYIAQGKRSDTLG